MQTYWLCAAGAALMLSGINENKPAIFFAGLWIIFAGLAGVSFGSH